MFEVRKELSYLREERNNEIHEMLLDIQGENQILVSTVLDYLKEYWSVWYSVLINNPDYIIWRKSSDNISFIRWKLNEIMTSGYDILIEEEIKKIHLEIANRKWESLEEKIENKEVTEVVEWNSHNLQIQVIEDEPVIEDFNLNIFKWTNLEVRVNNNLQLLTRISNNPKLLPTIKKEISKEVEKVQAWEWMLRIIELLYTLENTVEWASLLSKYSINDIFELNNPTILLWLMLWHSKERLNNTARREMLTIFFENITENSFSTLLVNIKNIDQKWLIFKPFVMELVTFIFRNIQEWVSLVEVPKKKNAIIDDNTFEVSFYWNKMHTTWYSPDWFDIEGFLSEYDDTYNAYSQDDETEYVSELAMNWQDFSFIPVSELFKNLDETTPLYLVLNYLKQNEIDLYTDIIIKLYNFKESWNVKLSWKSSRLLHELVNELFQDTQGKVLKPKYIEQQVIYCINEKYLNNNKLNTISHEIRQLTAQTEEKELELEWEWENLIDLFWEDDDDYELNI